MLNNLITFFGFIELLSVLGAFYCILANKNYRISESLSIGIFFVMVFLSLTYQVFFILGIPKFSYLVEIPLTLYSLIICYRHRSKFKNIYLQILKVFQLSRLLTTILILGTGYLLLQSIVLKPNNVDSLVYNLARVLLFQQENTLFLKNVNLYHQAVLPIGYDILYHIFLRSYQEFGLSLFGFLSFIGIGLSSWAIVTQYYSRKVALTSVLIILSMPQIVYAATTPKNDLVLGYIASIILLLSSKLLVHLEIKKILMICVALSFGLGAKTTFASFIIFYVPLFLYLLIKIHSSKKTFQTFWSHRFVMGVVLIPCMVLAQSHLFIWNYLHWGGFSGPSEFVNTVKNHDGFIGLLSNLIRYFLEAFHFPAPFDSAIKRIFGFSIPDTINALYHTWLYPFITNSGLSSEYSFQLQWDQTEHSWFGPFGFIILLCFPIFLWKGNHITKFAVIVLGLVFLLLCFSLTWTPMRDRYFSFLFGSSSLFAAFIANLIIQKKYLIKIVSAYCIISFTFAITFNITKPLFHFFSPRLDQMFFSSFIHGHNIWSSTKMGKQRFWQHSDISQFLCNIPTSNIGLFQAGHRAVFPFLISRPDCKFIPMERRIDDKHSLHVNYPSQLNDKIDYLLIVENSFKIDSNQLQINNQLIQTNKELRIIRQIEMESDIQNNSRLISLLSVG